MADRLAAAGVTLNGNRMTAGTLDEQDAHGIGTRARLRPGNALLRGSIIALRKC